MYLCIQLFTQYTLFHTTFAEHRTFFNIFMPSRCRLENISILQRYTQCKKYKHPANTLATIECNQATPQQPLRKPKQHPSNHSKNNNNPIATIQNRQKNTYQHITRSDAATHTHTHQQAKNASNTLTTTQNGEKNAYLYKQAKNARNTLTTNQKSLTTPQQPPITA